MKEFELSGYLHQQDNVISGDKDSVNVNMKQARGVYTDRSQISSLVICVHGVGI